MTWFRVALWVMLAALVLVVLGGYVSQWYRQQVSSTMDRMLEGSRDTESNEHLAPVAVGPERSVWSPQEQELLSLDTGFVDDDDDL